VEKLVAHGGFEGVEPAGFHQRVVQGVGPEGPNGHAQAPKHGGELKQKSSSHKQQKVESENCRKGTPVAAGRAQI
jgi:hypothetical protein